MQAPFGGLLGSTFNFVFENQLEKLQDGDRFYYLERTDGLSFRAELEFELLRQADHGEHGCGASAWPRLHDACLHAGSGSNANNSPDWALDGRADPTGGVSIGTTELTPLVIRVNPNPDAFYTHYLRYAGDHIKRRDGRPRRHRRQ